MFMCFFIYFIVYSGYFDFSDYMMFLMYLVHLIFCLFLHILCIRSVIDLFMWVWIQVHVRTLGEYGFWGLAWYAATVVVVPDMN